jgi:hypothetical protein
MFVVLGKDLSEQFVFGVVDGFDDILIIPGKVEKATTLPWRA